MRDLVDQTRLEVGYAFRGLRRSPGFTVTVILTLALGIGANAMMFGIVDRLLYRPYPYMHDPSSVHRVYWRFWRRGSQVTRSDTEYPRYLDLQRWTTSFSQYAAFTNRVLAVGTGDASRERMVGAVSATFFDFFDASPVLGRFFAADEDVPGRAADVAVLGYDFWKGALGGRDVRGEVLQVGNTRATIIGVAPRGFVGVNDVIAPAVYIPITTYARNEADPRTAQTFDKRYAWRWLEVMVRRKAGIARDVATADATQAALRSWQADRALDPSLATVDVARPDAVVSALKVGAGPSPSLEAKTTLWVTGVAVMVLLVAGANVTNLLLARTLRRQREMAVRLALGVSRRRLVAQGLIETTGLALAGGAAGVVVAQFVGPIIQRLLAGADVIVIDAAADGRTLFVSLGVAVVIALSTGLAATLLSGRGDLTGILRAGTRGGVVQRSRARTGLLVAQAALSTALLVGAGLFVKSLREVESMPVGYDTKSVVVATRHLRGTLDAQATAAIRERLLEAARAVPGVELASWTMTLPFAITNSTALFVPGIDSVARLGQFTYQAATSDYFGVMGTRIIRGRGFDRQDRPGAPRVTVVSDGMARLLWPAGNAIGQCVRVFADTMPCATVVGIAEDIVQDDLAATQRLHYYLPIDQFWPNAGSTLLMRVRGEPALHLESVRRALQRVMPGSSYVTVTTMASLVDGARRSWKLGALMFVAFGALALVVSAVGLYGVIAYDVEQRMHEMGVRIALGARASDVLGLVMRRSLGVAGLGVAIGLGLAIATAHWVQPLLFRASATDPVIYLLTSTLLGLVAVGASAAPSMRATRANPNSVLRSD